MTGAFRQIYLWLTEKLYQEWAAIYDPVSAIISAGQWGRWRRSALLYASGDDILELGFGTGHLLAEISRSGKRAFGLDVSPMMALRAARRQRCSRGQSLIVQGVAQRLPFVDGSFDAVVATFPSSYVLDRRTISECGRVLRSSVSHTQLGRIVVVGLWVRPECSVMRLLLPIFYGDPDWRTVSAYAVALKRAGLQPAVIEQPIGGFRIGSVMAYKTGR